MARKLKRIRNPFTLVAIMITIIVISTSSVFFAFYYRVYVSAVKDEAFYQNYNELKSSTSYLDNTLSVVSKMLHSLTYLQDIRNWSDDRGDFSKYHDIMNHLTTMRHNHSVIHSIYVVFENSDLILTGGEGYFDESEFYDDVWKNYSSFPTMTGNSNIRYSNARLVTPRSLSEVNVVALVSKVKLRDSDSEAFIVTNIDMNKLVKNMSVDDWTSSTVNDSTFMILSAYNDLIFENNQVFGDFSEDELNETLLDEQNYYNKTVNDDKYIYFNSIAPYSGWNVIRLSSYNYSFASLNWIRNIIVLALILCLISVVLLVFIIFKKVYLPYLRLINRFKKAGTQSTSEDGMSYLENIISQKLDTKEVLLESYLETLISKDHDSLDEDTNSIININEFIILLISGDAHSTHNFNISSAKILSLKHSINNYFANHSEDLNTSNIYLINMAQSKIAVILEMQEAVKTEEIVSSVRMLQQFLLINGNINCNFGISNSHNGTQELHIAYIEALNALRLKYFIGEKETVFIYSQFEQYNIEFYLEDNVKMDIFTNNLHHLNIDEAKDTLDLMFTDIYRSLETKLFYNIPSFISRLTEIIFNVADSFGIEPLDFNSKQQENYDIFLNSANFATIFDAVEYLKNLLDKLKVHQNELGNLKSKRLRFMLQYIEENYDGNLSLSEMADSMRMDQSYLSKQFKSKVGVSFIQYVTKYRIDRAKELLKSTDMKQSEIATQVGLSNAQNFIRIFKKYEGITPGQYKNTISRTDAT